MPARAVIYARISQDRTGERAGVERQVADCTALAERLGLEVIEVLDDNDKSAYSGKSRPGWQRVIELIKRREIDAIVAWHADRMYRRTRELEDLVDLIETHHTVIHTVQGGRIDLTSPDGRAMARLLGGYAQFESEHKSARIARKHADLAEAGKWKGGRRPFGYLRDGVTIFPQEAEAIRAAAQLLLKEAADGENPPSMADAARLVDKMLLGVPDFGEDGKEVVRKKKDPRSLRDTLLQPRIAGLRQYWSQADRNRFRRERAETRNDKNSAPFSIPWEELRKDAKPAEWEGILDMETWEALHEKLLAPDRKRTSRRPRRSMLAGLLKCGECFKEKDATGEPILHSLAYNPKAYTCTRCGTVAITVNAVERLISQATKEVLDRSPQEIPADAVEIADESPSRIAALDAREAVLVDSYAAGSLSDIALQRGLDKIRAERELVTKAEKRAHRELLERQELLRLSPAWEETADDPLLRGKIISLVADYFLVLRVARSGRNFQPGRVLAQWKDKEGLDALGPKIVPPEISLNRAAERKKELAAQNERGRLRRIEADKKRRERGAPTLYDAYGNIIKG